MAQPKNYGEKLMCINPTCGKFRERTYKNFFQTIDLTCSRCNKPLVKFVSRLRDKQFEKARKELAIYGEANV